MILPEIKRVLYPMQIQASNTNAADAFNVVMLHVFDITSEIRVFDAMTKEFLHVISYDSEGDVVREYDNR